MSTTILLADDHRIVREGLRTLLSQQPEMEVVGEAADGREAVSQALLLRPGVVVMDIAMPELNGVEATRRIRSEPGLAHVPIIAMTAQVMPGDQERCLAAGVDDFVGKPIQLARLAEVLDLRLRAAGSPV